MLTLLMNQWNPFNLYGKEVEVEDLICHPLMSTETLRQDSRGCCRRIKAPSLHSSLWEKWVFWLQIYLNEKDHLDAIDKIISLFQERLLQHPPYQTKELQEFNFQADKLQALQNDYGFAYLRKGDPSLVEFRLNAIKQQAYSIFAHYHEERVCEEEEARKQALILFQEDIEQKLKDLDKGYRVGLTKARFLLVASSNVQVLFEERVKSLQKRFKIIQGMQKKMDEMEDMLRGKFTMIDFENYFHRLRCRVCIEVLKIGLEAESMIENLMINSCISPNRETIESLLSSIEIHSEEVEISKIDANFFQENLNHEMKQIQGIFKSIFL